MEQTRGQRTTELFGEFRLAVKNEKTLKAAYIYLKDILPEFENDIAEANEATVRTLTKATFQIPTTSQTMINQLTPKHKTAASAIKIATTIHEIGQKAQKIGQKIAQTLELGKNR